VRRIDDDGARGFDRTVIDDLTAELRRQARRTLVRLFFRRQRSNDGAAAGLRCGVPWIEPVTSAGSPATSAGGRAKAWPASAGIGCGA
jgi:hypothetical protein